MPTVCGVRQVNTSTNLPTKAKGLVEFTAAKSGALAITDQLQADDGELTHSVCRTNIEFMVQHEGFWFAVHADQQGTKAVMKFHGIIGHLPYSYQSAFARSNIVAVVSLACREINAKMRIDENQRVLLIDEVSFEGSLTPKMVVAETTKILLKLKPYLLLISSLQLPDAASIPAPSNYIRQKDIEAEPEPSPVSDIPAPAPSTPAPAAEEPAIKRKVRVKKAVKVIPKKKISIKVKQAPAD